MKVLYTTQEPTKECKLCSTGVTFKPGRVKAPLPARQVAEMQLPSNGFLLFPNRNDTAFSVKPNKFCSFADDNNTLKKKLKQKRRT